MNLPLHTSLSRRSALAHMGIGLGGIAIDTLLADKPSPQKGPHFRPRAKQVILIFSSGGVSQLDLFDPKPELVKRHGEFPPDHLLKGERFAFINPKSKLMGSPWAFQPHGQSGMEFSELLPHLSTLADKSTIVRSVKTDNVNHTPAQILMGTGFEQPGRPSMGSWIVYGLGSENQDLPAFVDLYSNKAKTRTPLKSAGFLPGIHQAVSLRPGKDPIHFINNPEGMTSEDRRATIDAINQLNQHRHDLLGNPEIITRIKQYEMAFRMQSAVPELLDISGESEATLNGYGAERDQPSLARNMLLARRLVERGVRFVQLRDGGWDHHGEIKKKLAASCQNLDRPLAALINDLDQRGLLSETLVVWTSEFGRTPQAQGSGRDHHKHAFSVWMAGGGLKPGYVHGTTDELGYHVAEDPVHVHDLQATILELLGFDHRQLTYQHAGRDHRLTDVKGFVIDELIG